MKIKYRGNLIRYSVMYKGVEHIFCEANNYVLDFDDDFAKKLVKDSPQNFEVYKEKTKGETDGMQQEQEETENPKKKK